MAIRNPTELAEILGRTQDRTKARTQPILGLDLGAKTVGLAISDLSHTIASPLETLGRGKFKDTARQLQAIIDERAVCALVIGLPLNMDGSEGPRVQSTRQFAANILAEIDIDICFWDERLSTHAVESMMIEADLSRARRKQLVDKLAATYILQGCLDRMAAMGGGG